MFTASVVKTLYTFHYNPIYPPFNPAGDAYSNAVDHWGFYNGAINGSNAIPTVPGIYTGANRDAAIYCVDGSLTEIDDASGGFTVYGFGPNDILQYTTSTQTLSINVNGATQNQVTFSQQTGNASQLLFTFDNNFSRSGSAPFTGGCDLNCTITSTDGLTTFANFQVNLFEMYYVGSASYSVNLPNGNYRFVTSLPSCSVNQSLPVNVSWQNQTYSGTGTTMGGLRLLSVDHFDQSIGVKNGSSFLKYQTADGKSSGFLGTVPKYDYPYIQTVAGSGTTNCTAISSAPINSLSFIQGSPVGYSRVEVLKGSQEHNLGKTVYEYTSLTDANSSVTVPTFPYAPMSQRDWAMGLPKRVTVYDSSGLLVRITNNHYAITTVAYNDGDFTSLKLGRVAAVFQGDPTNPLTPYTESFTGQLYYPETGRSDLTATIDSVRHSDGSWQVTEVDYQTDTNYNVTNVISSFDKTRGLSLEKRAYYPYNYTLGGAVGKLRDSGILAAPVSTEEWITGDANPRLINARVTDFTQLPQGHVKPLTMYALQSNAPVPQTTIGAFDPSSLIRNNSFLIPQTSFLTYDNKGNLLETENSSSGQSNSVIMDYFQQFPIAKVSNARYSDIAYTSFESDGTGNWTIPTTTRASTAAYTGKLSYELASGSVSKTGLNASTSYLLTVWGYTGATITVNGASLSTSIAQQNNWSLYQISLSGTTTVTIGGSGLIDEVRLHPKDANMTSFTYEPFVGVTSSNDPNNTVGYVYYDGLYRAKVLKDKDYNVVKEFAYEDSLLHINMTPIWQNTGVTQCDYSVTGNINKQLIDTNPWSDTYNATRFVYDHNDCTVCRPQHCITEGLKVIGCNCETGTRTNLSSKKSGTTYTCTYAYCFSDGTSSIQYKETLSSPCTVQGPCTQ